MKLGLSAYAPPAPVPRMPAGLVQLMEGLSRDVLRSQPTDLYQFCVDHMQKLLILRAANEGRTRTMTLDEKIARAQKIIRQRAEKRRRRYDEPDRRSPGFSDEEESMDSDARVTPLGLSPRITVPGSFRPVSSEIQESSELSGEGGETTETTAVLEKAENGKDDTAKEGINEFINHDGDRKEVNDGKEQHSIENEQNEDVHVEQKVDENASVNIIESKNTEESKTTEISAVKTEKLLSTDTSIVNEAIIEECDELPIENHIYESGEKENETENKVIVAEETIEISTNEITSNNEATKKETTQVQEVTIVKENDESDSNSGIEKQVLEPVVELELNANREMEKITQNKIIDVTNDLSSVNLQDAADEITRIKSDEKLETSETEIQDEIEDSSEIKSDVNETIPDEETDGKFEDSTKMKPKEREDIPGNNKHNKIEVNIKVNTESQEDDAIEKINVTESKTNNSNDNNLETKSDYTEKEELNKHEFETVTIEVKAPTPLPEIEIKGGKIDQEVVKTEINIVESLHTEHEKGSLEFEKAEINNKEFKVYSHEPIEEIPKVANEILNNDQDDSSPDQHLRENEMIMMTKSCSNEDSASDNNAEVKQSFDVKNSAQPNTERMSYMSIPHDDDIDINALAKSDSTNDIIIEETTESISETNTEADEREENSNNAPTMDLETAAVTIQKVFRTFLFKSRASTLDDVSNDEGSMDAGMTEDILLDEGSHDTNQDAEFTNIKERRTLGITRMDTVLQTVNEEKSLSVSTDDSSTLSSAATTIQAHVRGFLVRNKLHSNKTTSLSSLVNSDGISSSLDADNEQQKSKTILNIHIVPEGGHFMSRDESMAMSLDLPLDNSPPSSLSSLHPLGSDVSERRKLLKREDAIQSISPPSNNSGKLSEDSGKEVVITESDAAFTHRTNDDDRKTDISLPTEQETADLTSGGTSPTKSVTVETVLEMEQEPQSKSSTPVQDENKPNSIEPSADEMDVVTPFVFSEEKVKVETPRLLHSGECHDVVLPTSVSRSEAAVVREFKNVLGYFLLWNSAS